MQKALESAARSAAAAGAKVVEVTLPPILEEAYAAQFIIQDYETSARSPSNTIAIATRSTNSCASRSMPRPRSPPTTTTRRAAPPSRARQVLADTMADHDVILTPSAPGAAPHGFGSTGNPMFNRLWTLMGTPCVNVPGLSEGDLPLGIQIVGRFGRDRAALEAALFVERAIARK